MARGRPRVRVIEVKFRMPEYLLPLLVAARPELFQLDRVGVFRYGALTRYLTQLIIRDIRSKGKPVDSPTGE